MAGFVICIIGAAYSDIYKGAFIMLGLLMLGAGIGGAVTTTKRHWMGLFIVNCIHGFTCILLLVLLIMAGLMAFEVRDPVTEAVENTWLDLRPELEAADFCTSVPAKQRHCKRFLDWAEVATVQNNRTRELALAALAPAHTNLLLPCRWTDVEMAQNCTRTLECDTSASDMHNSECNICDTECKGVLLDELRGNVGWIATFFYVVFWGLVGVLLFNIRMADICSDIDDWNEFMKQEAKKRGVDEYDEEGMQGTSMHKMAMLVNLCLAVAGLLCSILASVILSTMSDLFSSAAWGILFIGLALTVTGGALFFGARTTTTSILKTGNYLLTLFTALFLFFAVLLSMTTGDVSDLHQSVDAEWPNTKIKVERDEPGYCSFDSGSCQASEDNNQCKMTSEECKAKYMDDVQQNVTNMFTLVFLEMGFLGVLVLLTNDVVSLSHR